MSDSLAALHAWYAQSGLPMSCWDCWPKEEPRPSDEMIEAARQRLREDTEKSRERGYEGDFGFTLELTVGTYNPLLWLKYFFPEREKEFEERWCALVRGMA